MEDSSAKEILRNIFEHRKVEPGIKFYKNTNQSSDLITEFLALQLLEASVEETAL